MPRAVHNWSEAADTGRQLRRFLIVGMLCVLVDYGTYRALVNLLADHTNLAKGISYLAGVVVGFLLNKRWTFESARKTWSEPISYLLLYAATLLVNVACNHLVLESLGDEAHRTAYLIATGITTVLNFLGMRLVTFRGAVSERRAALDHRTNAGTPWRKAG